MTIEQRNEQIAAVMASGLYLPLKAARIREIHDRFDREEYAEKPRNNVEGDSNGRTNDSTANNL